MNNIGGIFGIIALICILTLALRPILQVILGQLGQNGKTVPDLLEKLFQFLTKTHRYVGFIAVVAVFLHFALRYQQYGVRPLAGWVAGLFLVMQSFLGFGLTKQKDEERLKKMAILHRILGFLIIVSVLTHRIVGI